MSLTIEKACRALSGSLSAADDLDDPNSWMWVTHKITGMQLLCFELSEYEVASDLQLLWTVAFRRSVMAR